MTDELAGVGGENWWRSIAVTALQVLRPFIKMDNTQSTAWDLVVRLLGGSS